ncbi:MAG: serine/threonine-protein kinase [Sandaracinaceae bacterium]
MRAEIGAIIDRKYEILSPLGSGGMGSVYRARHVLTEQLVALKLLRVGPGDEAIAHRFKIEVSVAAKVKHPGIVRVYDAGTEPDAERFYLAMELLEGRSLRDAMDADDAEVHRLVGYLADTLDVMAAAHGEGVIHRDLKPDNLFLEDGPGGPRVRILDFGIARDLAGPSVTSSGMALGTALYMAPEQGTGSREIGPSADTWAVGVMLYEILAGRVPFDGPSAHAVVVDAVTRPHTPLSLLRADLEPEWGDLVDRCLSKDPKGRPPADELESALRVLLAHGESLDAPPVRATGPVIGLRASTQELAATEGAQAVAAPLPSEEAKRPGSLALDERDHDLAGHGTPEARRPWTLAVAAGALVAAAAGAYALWSDGATDAGITPELPHEVLTHPADLQPEPTVPTPVEPNVRAEPTARPPEPSPRAEAPVSPPPADPPVRPEPPRPEPRHEPERRSDPPATEVAGVAPVRETPPPESTPTARIETPPTVAPTEPPRERPPDPGLGLYQGADDFDRDLGRNRRR